MINYSIDTDGIATLAWDMPGRPMNVLNEGSMAAFGELVQRAIADPAVKGVIVTSAKPDFIVGADLDMLLKAADKQAIFDMGMRMHRLLRGMETSGKPFVAVINGTALGGGLEVALACHYRVAANKPKAQIGLPEAQVGLLPGGGGTQRLPRLIGIQQALPLMIEGKRLDVKTAQSLGIVHAMVEPGSEMEAARRWILEGGKPEQPWDKKGFKIPGGAVQSPTGMQIFTAGNAMLREKTFGNYPAAKNIMSCVYEGLQVDIDTALKIEARYFVATATSPEAKNMIRTLFFSMGEANKLVARPKDIPKQSYTKVGILGAGMMGAGVAYATAKAGIDVVLLDTTIEAAHKGKAYSETLLAKSVSRGKMSKEAADQILARIQPTTHYAHLEGCELIIEAVFENREIKAEVTKKTEAVIAADAIFGSNTSTLPITGLAEASSRPANFIGVHFFSPVDKMPLVEIIMGKQTSQATLARTLDYVKAIGKTPIVVNDSRGFYTSRVFATYVMEGMAMLAEGVAPALIEHAGKMAGMPLGPLMLSDEVAIDLSYKIMKQTEKDMGAAYVKPAGADVIAAMVEKFERVGKKAGKGFYDYPQDGPKQLWPGLATHFPVRAEQPAVEEVIQRLIYAQCVETVRCMEENVVTTARDADVGAILGWGFAPFRGGPISQVQTVGVGKFVEQCDQLASKFGKRFAPPKKLREMAAKGETFYAA